MILKLFFGFCFLFCLTIGQVYAEETTSVDAMMPNLVIDLSSVASQVWFAQAQVWVGCSVVALLVAIVAWIVLNINPLKQQDNQGDVLAKRVSLLWVAFLMMMVVGFAIPLLRVWLVW
jgi:H+/Cl- antiporter ClcA